MREREGEWRGEGERERAREEQGQRERERERRKWLVVTHARFFRQTAFLKIFPPVAACRFKSPGRSRRFSNAPNTACTSLRRAPPIATASNIFFPFFIRLFFYFLFFFSSTLSFFFFFSFIPPLPFHTSLSLVVAVLIFRGKNSQGRANIFFFFFFFPSSLHETRWNSISRLEKVLPSFLSHRLTERKFLLVSLRVRRVSRREIRIRQKCVYPLRSLSLPSLPPRWTIDSDR